MESKSKIQVLKLNINRKNEKIYRKTESEDIKMNQKKNNKELKRLSEKI